MPKLKNEFYKEFHDGFLLKEIDRTAITKVIDNIDPLYPCRDQARTLLIIAWSTGARPNEYLRLIPKDFSLSTEFLEIKVPASKGSSPRTIGLPRYMDDGSIDSLTSEVYDYVKSIALEQSFIFWKFRSDAIKHGVTKKYKKKDGSKISKEYNKIYDHISSKLDYYFKKWFDCLVPGGIPAYYLRHNRATRILEVAGREATIQTFGWKTEATLKKYSHLTKQMRKEIGKGLMK